VKDLASAFEAANTLVELAKSQALAESEAKDEAELAKLKESYGSIGSKLATGGSKAVKELEKNQKMRITKQSRDFIESCITSYFHESLKVFKNEGAPSSTKPSAMTATLNTSKSLQKTSTNLEKNSSVQLALEALFLKIYLKKTDHL
jgi:DNA polymerase-3 subunit delta'